MALNLEAFLLPKPVVDFNNLDNEAMYFAQQGLSAMKHLERSGIRGLHTLLSVGDNWTQSLNLSSQVRIYLNGREVIEDAPLHRREEDWDIRRNIRMLLLNAQRGTFENRIGVFDMTNKNPLDLEVFNEVTDLRSYLHANLHTIDVYLIQRVHLLG